MKEFPWEQKSGSFVPRSQTMVYGYFQERAKKDGWTRANVGVRGNKGFEEMKKTIEEQAREIEELRAMISIAAMSAKDDDDGGDADAKRAADDNEA